jgi:hypothetical protein
VNNTIPERNRTSQFESVIKIFYHTNTFGPEDLTNNLRKKNISVLKSIFHRTTCDSVHPWVYVQRNQSLHTGKIIEHPLLWHYSQLSSHAVCLGAHKQVNGQRKCSIDTQ